MEFYVENIIQIFPEQLSVLIPYLIILGVLWTTYSYVVFHSGFVSDDIQGIQGYDGTLLYPVEDKDGKTSNGPDGKVITARKISYGTLSKWVRNKLCGGMFPSSQHYPKKPDGTEGDFIPCAHVPARHHVLSLVVASIAVVLLYNFLITVTTPTVAILTVCLFIVHPTCVQAVAWPSAIGYILSLICICASLNIAHWTVAQSNQWLFVLGLGGLAFFQIWGVYAQAIPMATWLILLVLGQWQMALVAFVFSTLTAARNLREYVVYRKQEFKKQHMESSTSLNVRKPIVALKTLAYYIYLAVFPNRMGLYHKWGFHYDKKMELWDWRAICGLIVFGVSVYSFCKGPLEVKIGIVWFYAFISLFLNWITAQQWVTERYLYIPVIGLCLISSLFLQHLLPLYFFIFGMFMCRTLCHLPIYDSELRFYLSNAWNFPDSEVALGNLGVAYTSVGLSGAAGDMWLMAGTINAEYDVPFYNLFSKQKTQGLMLIQSGAYEQGIQTLANSIPILDKVLSCKVLHFPDQWKKESDDLKRIIENPVNMLMGELQRLQNLKESLNVELAKAKDKKRIDEITPSITNNENQINNLIAYFSSKGISVNFDPQRALLNQLITGGTYGNASPIAKK